MKYKVRTKRGKHPLVEVVFENEDHSLIGEMLLAERPFLDGMIKALEAVLSGGEISADSFSGNAFTIYITKETARISNDINGLETEAPTADLKKLVKAYKKQYDRIKR